MFEPGSHVIVVDSPYSCVPNGTRAVVEAVIPAHFADEISTGVIRWSPLIVLAGLRCKNFREHEIRLAYNWDEAVNTSLEKHADAWRRLAEL